MCFVSLKHPPSQTPKQRPPKRPPTSHVDRRTTALLSTLPLKASVSTLFNLALAMTHIIGRHAHGSPFAHAVPHAGAATLAYRHPPFSYAQTVSQRTIFAEMSASADASGCSAGV
eukprot:scaffold103446_cov63-Phaeocystis_antarctica.AAC.3